MKTDTDTEKECSISNGIKKGRTVLMLMWQLMLLKTGALKHIEESGLEETLGHPTIKSSKRLLRAWSKQVTNFLQEWQSMVLLGVWWFH